MNGEYLKPSINGQCGYVRSDCLDWLKTVGAIIFDCDGVLIDVRKSYKKTVVKTVEFFVDGLTGVKLPSDDALNKTIYLLKVSGGFNNDWDVAYSILLSLFSTSPRFFQEKIIGLVKSDEFERGTLHERFQYVKASLEDLKPMSFIKDWSKLRINLNELTEKADASGINSVERELILNPASKFRPACEALKRFLAYPGRVGESLLTTVFEEIFFGSKLFKEKNRFSPMFYTGRGLVEEEKIVITPETLSELAEIIGEKKFGIVSGRDYCSAKHTLGKILDEFREEALFFLLDLEAELFEKYKKPNPLPLVKSAEGLKPFKYAIYVGDSIEDILMVERANKMDQRFISMGVYSYSEFQEEFISHLTQAKTDIILPSVNNLPSLLRMIMEDEI